MVDHRGNAPRPDCLQGSPAPLCAARAQSWFRANLSAASARRRHQISFLSEVMRRVRRRELVRIEGIEPPSPEWRSGAQPIDQIRVLALLLQVGGKWMESNLLPQRDRVYSAATAPACPYRHFPD
jgi:hypothetical protein